MSVIEKRIIAGAAGCLTVTWLALGALAYAVLHPNPVAQSLRLSPARVPAHGGSIEWTFNELSEDSKGAKFFDLESAARMGLRDCNMVKPGGKPIC